MKYQLYLSIGSNIGDAPGNLREAMRRIWCLPETQLLMTSSFYKTPPWGKLDQDDFLNAVLKVATNLKPIDFLHLTQRIETEMGRVRHEKWGARLIDIDILYAEKEQAPRGRGLKVAPGREPVYMDTDELKLPHPYFSERAFVLVPWREITPGLAVKGRTVAEWSHEPDVEQQAKKVDFIPFINDPYPFKMIACVDEEWGIGRDGGLLECYHEDMERFREKTLHSLVIMGRKTYESLPRLAPLAERRNMIVTRRQNLSCDPHFDIARSLKEIYTIAMIEREDFGDIDLWVIGGAELFRQLMPFTEEIHLTHIAGTHGADTFFPHEGLAEFDLAEEEQGEHCRFCIYRRRHD